MGKKKAMESAPKPVVGDVFDPTLKVKSVVVRDKVYHLCFNMRALAQAEHKFNKQGYTVNLFAALPALNLENICIIFAAAIQKFHPEIGFEQAIDLLDLDDVYPVASKIAEAWNASLPEPEKQEEGSGKADPTPSL